MVYQLPRRQGQHPLRVGNQRRDLLRARRRHRHGHLKDGEERCYVQLVSCQLHHIARQTEACLSERPTLTWCAISFRLYSANVARGAGAIMDRCTTSAGGVNYVKGANEAWGNGDLIVDIRSNKGI